jgi:hypothetical protein
MIVCLLSNATLVHAQTTRQLNYEEGVAIASLINPGDRRVEIYSQAPLMGFFSGKLPPGELLLAHALDAEAILVITIDKQTPHLTPRADWIETTFQASIVEQLRPSKPIASRAVRMDLDGGTLDIRGATVTAIAEWAPRLQLGARYLLFVNHLRDPVDGLWAYRIGENELLESTWNAFYDHGAADSVHGMPFAEARAILLKGVANR